MSKDQAGNMTNLQKSTEQTTLENRFSALTLTLGTPWFKHEDDVTSLNTVDIRIPREILRRYGSPYPFSVILRLVTNLVRLRYPFGFLS